MSGRNRTTADDMTTDQKRAAVLRADQVARLATLRALVSRMDAQHAKGKARDRAALEFLCGAGAATITKNEAGEDHSPFTIDAFLVSCRGYSSVLETIETLSREVTK